MLGLSRLGYAVLILSPRLSAHAFSALLSTTGSSILAHSAQLAAVVADVQQQRPGLRTLPLLTRADFAVPVSDGPRFVRAFDGPRVALQTAFITHSSGSTGLPKPIFHIHSRYRAGFVHGFDYSAFVTLPLYHTYGLTAFFRAVQGRTVIYLFNGNHPMTGDNLIEVLDEIRPEMTSAVPYVLKLLGEKPKGIEVLKACKLVTYHGSRCPDELGDRLVDQGVYLVAHLGS